MSKKQSTNMPEYHNLDRGRLFIPDKCRHHFKCSLGLTLDDQKRFIAVQPYEESRVKLDSRGRLTIPKALRDEANIRDVVVIRFISCLHDYFEIWNPVSWEKETQTQSSTLR